jgi:hypothetical protein
MRPGDHEFETSLRFRKSNTFQSLLSRLVAELKTQWLYRSFN